MTRAFVPLPLFGNAAVLWKEEVALLVVELASDRSFFAVATI